MKITPALQVIENKGNRPQEYPSVVEKSLTTSAVSRDTCSVQPPEPALKSYEPAEAAVSCVTNALRMSTPHHSNITHSIQ